MYSEQQYRDSLNDPDESRRGRARLQLNGEDLVVRIRAFEPGRDEVWIEGGEPAGAVQVTWAMLELAPTTLRSIHLQDMFRRLEALEHMARSMENAIKLGRADNERLTRQVQDISKPRKRRR